ncbi:hypothetical protein GQ42DRAFT_153264 [Ramicandelaber brevisporus]|nr:hypothetical protein GQ42DRAFT_153264 [Ramicandelaber brevisporus]
MRMPARWTATVSVASRLFIDYSTRRAVSTSSLTLRHVQSQPYSPLPALDRDSTVISPATADTGDGRKALKFRINDKITAPNVRLIDALGNQRGVTPLSAALESFNRETHILVETNATAAVPVCRVMLKQTFNEMVAKQMQSAMSSEGGAAAKIKSDKDSKKTKSKKASDAIKTKEIQLTSKIEKHDLMHKLKHAAEFLSKGHRLNIVVKNKFKGPRIQGAEKDKDRVIPAMVVAQTCLDELAKQQEYSIVKKPHMMGGNAIVLLHGKGIAKSTPTSSDAE